LAALLLLGGLLAVPSPASAAETYDICAGYIESLPATISRQGVWCLRKNLSASIGNGNAITIATNDVTIECNDFRGGGLAAVPTSAALAFKSVVLRPTARAIPSEASSPVSATPAPVAVT